MGNGHTLIDVCIPRKALCVRPEGQKKRVSFIKARLAISCFWKVSVACIEPDQIERHSSYMYRSNMLRPYAR